MAVFALQVGPRAGVFLSRDYRNGCLCGMLVVADAGCGCDAVGGLQLGIANCKGRAAILLRRALLRSWWGQTSSARYIPDGRAGGGSRAAQ